MEEFHDKHRVQFFRRKEVGSLLRVLERIHNLRVIEDAV